MLGSTHFSLNVLSALTTLAEMSTAAPTEAILATQRQMRADVARNMATVEILQMGTID
jgi:hypothetical protein